MMLFPVLVLLWIGLSPKGTIPGIQYFSFLVIFIIAASATLLSTKGIIVNKNLLIYCFIFLSWWFSTLISFVFNINEIRISAFFETGKPVLYAALFLCGYYSLKENGESDWQWTITLISKFLILFILSVSIVQLFSPDFFSFIWSSDKTRGIGSLVRVTGTMYNPNLMAFFVSFLCYGIVAGQRIKSSWVWVLISLILIILSGSRTLMLAFPTGLAVLHWFHISNKGLVRGSIRMVGLFLAFFTLIYLSIYSLSDHLPYASQLLKLFESGASASDVHSFSVREMQWKSKLDLWLSGGVTTILFGAGSIQELQVGDNDFIYVLTRLGIVGVATHILMYLIIFAVSWQTRSSVLGIWLAGLMTMILLAGVTLETLGGWQPPIYIFLIAGAAIATMDETSIKLKPLQI